MIEVLTVRQAANHINKSDDTIRRLCKLKAFTSFKVKLQHDKVRNSQHEMIVIPRAEFIEWAKKLKVRDKSKKEIEFTMNCFSFSCTKSSNASKSVIKTVNKFVQECPDCKSILVKRRK